MSSSVLLPPPATQTEFSIGQARALVRDLFEPKAIVYWGDFLLSIGLGATGFMAIENRDQAGRLVDLICQALRWQTAAGHWTVVGALFVVHCLAFYRAALFTPELVHIREGAARGFR